MARQRSRIMAIALALASVLWPAGAFAQASAGTIQGRVFDANTERGIAEAQVFVVGSNLGARTNDQGYYTIRNVPVGTHQVRVMRLGYESQTKTAMVSEQPNVNQGTNVDFALEQRAVVLEQVVTTATGEQQRARETGNSVGVITAEEIVPATTQNFSQVLAGRTAGVTVAQSGGTTGTGAKIRIRGANSLSLSNEPLLIIDGVRVNNDPQANSIGVGGQSPSRLNDINPEDIASVEVLKGPAASALYGTAAANGVIQITTKRGREGRPIVNTYYEYGLIRETNDYPANYLGLDAGGDPCFTIDEAEGLCTISDILSFNPIETNSPFRDGNRQKVGLSLSGGSSGTTFFLSGDYEDEAGVYTTSNLDRVNLRANLTGKLYDDRVDFTVTSSYLTSDLQLPQNDNNILGVISGGLLGNVEDDANCGYIFACPEVISNITTMQEVERFVGGLSGTVQATSWLRFVGNAGLDMLNRFDNELIPPNEIAFGDLIEGERTSNRFQVANYTGNASGTASFAIRPTLLSSTSLGVQFQREFFRGTNAYGAVLTPGTGNLEGTAARFAVGESYVDNRTLGAFIQQQLSFNDRVFLTLALRGDDNSAFGQQFGFAYYPAASVSWVISEEEFFPTLETLTSLRLRGAYGQSGLRPSFRDAVTYFSPVAVRADGSDVPAFTFAGLGDATLEPERTSEWEFGFDAGFWDNRVAFEGTYYDKTSRDALVRRRTATSTGAPTSVFANLGSVSNRGVELLLTSTPLQSDNLTAEFSLTYSYNINNLEDLGTDAAGNPIPPIIFGLGGDTQRHQEGFPLGAYFQRPILGYSDANGDGVLSASEVEVGTTPQYLGASIPSRMASLTGSLTFLQFIKLSGLLDYKGGYQQFNSTEEFRCGAFFNCRAINDPTAPLEEQARAVAAAVYGTAAGYIEDADFVKLRELALTFTAPSQLAQRAGVAGISLTIAGNNLATWTDYTGFDPEINFIGADNFRQAEFLTQPPVRYYTTRLNVTF